VPAVRYLSPDPDTPAPTLTAVVVPVQVADPLVGGFRDAQRERGTLAEMRAAERVVQQELPLAARAERILLIAGTRAPNSWRIIHEFPLRQSSRGGDHDFHQ